MGRVLDAVARTLGFAPAPDEAERRHGDRRRGLGGALYTGAALHRLTSDWTTRLLAPSDELQGSLVALRARARDLRRNDPYVARYAALCVEHVLGPEGITLQAQVPSTRGANTGASKQCEAVWYEWCDRAGLDGSSWWDVCALLVEAYGVEGEPLLEIVYDRALPFGVGVQVLDPDLLDHDYTRAATATDNAVVMGVEVDRIGRAVAYHLWTEHPTAVSTATRRRRRRVTADRICTMPHAWRPQQLRGVTPLAPVMYRLQMLGGTQEALVTLHRIAASKMGWLKQTTEADPLAGLGEDGDLPAGPPPDMEADPGRIGVLPAGYDFMPWDPGQPTQQYDPFARMLVREVAAGLGVTYAALTGDLSEANYSSMRVGLMSERDGWRVRQRRFAAAFCQPVYAAVLRGARMRGAITRPDGVTGDQFAAATWHGRRWGWVDPSKDIAATVDALGAGLTTLTRELNTQGLDVADVLRERSAELKLAKDLDVPLTTTPTPAPTLQKPVQTAAAA